jgi:hypothetical protein
MARFVFLFSCMLILGSGALVVAQFDDISAIYGGSHDQASLDSCMQTRNFCGNL